MVGHLRSDNDADLPVPYLCEIIYPFKLLTVGMHEMCHAIAGTLTCARVESISVGIVTASAQVAQG